MNNGHHSASNLTANVTHGKGITDVSSRAVTESTRHHLAVAIAQYDNKQHSFIPLLHSVPDARDQYKPAQMAYHISMCEEDGYKNTGAYT
jgi:hypothetical protein